MHLVGGHQDKERDGEQVEGEDDAGERGGGGEAGDLECEVESVGVCRVEHGGGVRLDEQIVQLDVDRACTAERERGGAVGGVRRERERESRA